MGSCGSRNPHGFSSFADPQIDPPGWKGVAGMYFLRLRDGMPNLQTGRDWNADHRTIRRIPPYPQFRPVLQPQRWPDPSPLADPQSALANAGIDTLEPFAIACELEVLTRLAPHFESRADSEFRERY